MRVLIFCPDQDTPGKRDMSGAFLPEARAFAKQHGALPEEVIKRFPARLELAQRRAATSLAIKGVGAPIDVLAFFCHGWKSGIQAGFLRQHAMLLARILTSHARLTAYVAIYGCDTARDLDDATDDRSAGPGGDDGFADTLRDSCESLGRRVTVIGHTTAGHCSMNPHTRFFAPGEGGKGGRWFVEPGSELWPLWVAALQDPRNTLRYRFYWMTPAEIADELRGGQGPAIA